MADNIIRQPPQSLEKEAHLLDYLHVLQRRWRVALAVLLLVLISVTWYTSRQTPIYQATAILRVGYKPPASDEVLQRRPENRFSMASELRVLQSQIVAEQASEILARKWQPLQLERGIDLHVRTLTGPTEARQLTVELTDSSGYRLLDEQGQPVLQGVSGRDAESGGWRAHLLIHAGNPGDRVALRRLSPQEAIAVVMSGVSARELEEGTNLISLSVQGPDPVLAADVANALAEAYTAQSREAKAADALSRLQFIDQQLGKLGSDLDQSEQALHAYRIKTGLERLSPEGQSLVDSAVLLETQRTGLNLRLERLEAFLTDFKWNRDDYTTFGDLPGIDEFVSQLLALRANRLDLLRMLTTAHPKVIEVDNQINQVREKIYSTANLEKSRIVQQLADINAAIQQSTRRLEQAPEEELELVRLSRANQVNAELYSYLLQRQQETRIAAAATAGNVELVDRARIPDVRITPNKKKALLTGLLAGLVLGVGLTFLLDYLDRTIKDEEDVHTKLGLPVLGTIPRIKEAAENEERQLVTQLEPMSPPAEAFLALRTNLLYILTNQKHKTLMLTSCMADEGKSTIAVNLAATLAQTGARTLLIGCDLRRPSLYRALGETEAPGLTDLLMNHDRAAVRRIEQLNLDFLPAGTEVPNPTQLLNSPKMAQFLSSAKNRYDYVILDVPPLLPVSDALILASLVDFNVLVVEACRVPERIARRALTALQRHDAVPAGIVLNDKTGKGARYYGEYSYYDGKYYQGYYRRDEAQPEPPLWRRVMSRLWGLVNG